MPIYEFYCPDNHRIYSFYARSLAYADRTPRCPENSRFRMERMISNFAITGRAKKKTEAPAGAEDPRLEAAMAEMERDFGGMDTENPDPKMLARMMRKMTELGGGKAPREMEEMIRRMEAGEDPEKLDAEYGDALEGFDPLGNDAAEDVKARLRALRRAPQRDPVLYEMSNFVDAAPPAPAARKRTARR